MATVSIELTDRERELLQQLLERELGEVRIEARRTRAPDWHDSVLNEESQLRQLLSKLQAPAGARQA